MHGILKRVVRIGYAFRDPRNPQRITTLAIPIAQRDAVQALVSVSIFGSAVPPRKLPEQIIDPLLTFRESLEIALNFSGSDAGPPDDRDDSQTMQPSF